MYTSHTLRKETGLPAFLVQCACTIEIATGTGYAGPDPEKAGFLDHHDLRPNSMHTKFSTSTGIRILSSTAVLLPR